MTFKRRGGLADEVVTYVRTQILSGSMRPGQKIDQDAIGEALGLSRSPIREGLVVLGQEGLVDITPRRGAFVAKITREDVLDHYALFGLVSGRVAAIAATALSVEDREQLRSVHERFVHAPAEDYAKFNDEFHQVINSAAPRRTRWLLRQLERSIPAGFFEFTPGWYERAIADHLAILNAVIAGDADAARSTMEHHLNHAGITAAEALSRRGFWEEHK